MIDLPMMVVEETTSAADWVVSIEDNFGDLNWEGQK